ncbi:MAG: tRNA pseudouridine(38-40) synthase TruA [Pseudomonadota bacterium]
MPLVKLVVEYNGSKFHGWQKQPGLRTVQGELERVLSTVARAHVAPLRAAGRTDAGVHARGQVVTFRVGEEIDLRRLMNGVSHLMKGELSVVSAEFAPEGFHPGISSTHKQYSYRILNRPTPAVLDAHTQWHIAHPLNLERMRSDASLLVGTMDYSSFRDSSCTASTPVKTIYRSYFEVSGDVITYYVVGKGFLKQMVRNIVGTLTDIGRGRITNRSFAEIIAARDRRLAGVTAPPHGLCMDWVSYEALAGGLPGDCEIDHK